MTMDVCLDDVARRGCLPNAFGEEHRWFTATGWRGPEGERFPTVFKKCEYIEVAKHLKDLRLKLHIASDCSRFGFHSRSSCFYAS